MIWHFEFDQPNLFQNNDISVLWPGHFEFNHKNLFQNNEKQGLQTDVLLENTNLWGLERTTNSESIKSND